MTIFIFYHWNLKRIVFSTVIKEWFNWEIFNKHAITWEKFLFFMIMLFCLCITCDAYLWGHFVLVGTFRLHMWNCATCENLLYLWWFLLLVIPCHYLWWLVFLWVLVMLEACVSYFCEDLCYLCWHVCFCFCFTCGIFWDDLFLQLLYLWLCLWNMVKFEACRHFCSNLCGSFSIPFVHPVCCHGEVGCSHSWNFGDDKAWESKEG